MSKHTPGPWFVDAHNNVLAEGCLVAFPSVAAGLEKQEANARLIAAAPETAAERDRLKEINAELLAAAQWVIRNPGAHPSNIRSVLEDAVTKAKGD